jgi:predicted PurR-regulated permease PerM
MTDQTKASDEFEASTKPLIILAVRMGCLGLLIYWSVVLVWPFLTVIAWSVVFAVALYPVFGWTAARLGGRRVLAATIITVVSLAVILGPVAWLGVSLAESVRILIGRLGDGTLALPAPPDSVKGWPLIGEKTYDIWRLASTNLKALLINASSDLRPLATSLLRVAGTAGLNLLKFLAGVAISGFLFVPGRSLVYSTKNVLRPIVSERGEGFIDLAGATIRNVSRGVIGISVLQALLAGIGLMVAGIPAAGLLSFVALVLGIIQIGPSVVLVPLVIWSWFAMDATSALIFTAYMLPVSLLDNVLRPIVMAHGLRTPMLVMLAGVIGGTLVHGLIGLFIGPVVLSITWQLLLMWTAEGEKEGVKKGTMTTATQETVR